MGSLVPPFSCDGAHASDDWHRLDVDAILEDLRLCGGTQITPILGGSKSTCGSTTDTKISNLLWVLDPEATNDHVEGYPIGTFFVEAVFIIPQRRFR